MNSLVSALAIGLALVVASAKAQAETLELAATEWPPFYGSDLPDNGFMTEIVIEALGRAGFETDVDFLPWRRAFEGTRDGQFDGLFTMWHRPEREEHFIFSDALPSNELVFLVRAEDVAPFEGFEALKDKTIGVVRDYAPPPGFEEAGLSISEARDDDENIRKLLRGRIDMVLTERIVAQHIINTNLAGDADQFGWMEPPVHVDVQYMVVPRALGQSESVMTSFNAALAEMTVDGTVEKIMSKHGF